MVYMGKLAVTHFSLGGRSCLVVGDRTFLIEGQTRDWKICKNKVGADVDRVKPRVRCSSILHNSVLKFYQNQGWWNLPGGDGRTCANLLFEVPSII